MTKVLVVDDQRIAREYMENVVLRSEGYELAGSLTKADFAAAVCRRSAVDLILMDVCTHGRKDGIEAAELREQFPKLKIIIVTSMPEESYMKRAKEVGVDSFWHKEVSPEELITVMDATMQGRQVWPGEMPAVRLGSTTSKELTDAQLKVLRLVCEGLEYNEIAQELNITVRTVKWHVYKILEETGFSNKTQLAIAVTGKRLIIPRLLDHSDDEDVFPSCRTDA
jgi:DNA-binding NarL/FixJ family response regulator